MKYLLFLLGWTVIVSAMNDQQCILGPARDHSFLYCPTNYSNMSANYHDMSAVTGNYYSTVLLGTAIPMSLTIAGSLLVGCRNHAAYIAKSVVLVGMTSLVVGTLTVSLADPDQLRDFPNAWDNVIFWYSTFAGCLAGSHMVSMLRRV
jgi:hypothetical protein